MRKFLVKISYTVLPVWILLVALATYLWVTDDNSGDLMRLGLIESGPEYADSISAGSLSEVYYNSEDNDSLLRLSSFDVLVVGDSFSHGGGIGKVGDYVNYLAHDGNLKVTVFTPQDPTLSSPIQLAYDVLNLESIDSSRVKNLVVQEVERYIVERHAGFVTSHKSIPLPQIKSQVTDENPALGNASTGPLMRVKDYIFYHLFGANPIYKARLSQPMFGGKEPTMLYFYNEDVKNGISVPVEAQQRIQDNYSKLIAKAREKGINLIILIACDKYDLYQDFIVDNSYPEKTLNEDIARWMAADTCCFVFSKQLLRPLVEQGVKDVYLFNDTHWSPASSRIIAEEIIKKLK